MFYYKTIIDGVPTIRPITIEQLKMLFGDYRIQNHNLFQCVMRSIKFITYEYICHSYSPSPTVFSTLTVTPK